jgi:hypothetical protein
MSDDMPTLRYATLLGFSVMKPGLLLTCCRGNIAGAHPEGVKYFQGRGIAPTHAIIAHPEPQ